LDELLAAGIVLKVVARPGFMISPDPSQAWSLLLCNVCGVVIPFAADAADVEFADLAAAAGFTPARRHIEVTGTCSACQ
jgi:Fe2+ or Zn2+ uptake regulation protein